MKHLIEPSDLTPQEIGDILDLADKIVENPDTYAEKCRRKKLATLFYEPSTRTRLSFEAAMIELGGNVIGFAGADSSSAAKGESIMDTIRTVQSYADIVAIRHPKEGSAKVATLKAEIPIINAGDGGHQHPTQTLTDLLTIRSLKGRLTNMTIGLCGDLMFGRTVHSLIRATMRYEGIRFLLVSPPELRVPDYILEDLQRHSIPYQEVDRLEKSIGEMDVLYMTRVQKERFFNEEDYIRLRDSYILDLDKMALARPDMIVLHPLPRVNEIEVAVDDDPRACYFKQARLGKYVRMALILKLLEVEGC